MVPMCGNFTTNMYKNNMLWKLTFAQHYKQYDTF